MGLGLGFGLLRHSFNRGCIFRKRLVFNFILFSISNFVLTFRILLLLLVILLDILHILSIFVFAKRSNRNRVFKLSFFRNTKRILLLNDFFIGFLLHLERRLREISSRVLLFRIFQVMSRLRLFFFYRMLRSNSEIFHLSLRLLSMGL